MFYIFIYLAKKKRKKIGRIWSEVFFNCNPAKEASRTCGNPPICVALPLDWHYCKKGVFIIAFQSIKYIAKMWDVNILWGIFMENLFIFMEIKLSKKKTKLKSFCLLEKCLLERMGFTKYPYESTVFI